MAALNAITNDALLSIVEWGSSTLRAPGAGETAHTLANVGGVDEAVITTEGPLYTKVVASVATAMTAGEKQAVLDADSDEIDGFVAVLDVNRENEYDGVNGAVVLSWAQLDLKVEITGNLTSGQITFIDLPPTGMVRQITIQVIQGGAGAFTMDVATFTGVDWGTDGAPTFGDAAGKTRFVVLYCNGAGDICGFAGGNVFG